jgi:hypothetical protein
MLRTRNLESSPTVLLPFSCEMLTSNFNQEERSEFGGFGGHFVTYEYGRGLSRNLPVGLASINQRQEQK